MKRTWVVWAVILFMLGSLALFLFRGNTKPGWELPDWEMRDLGADSREGDSR